MKHPISIAALFVLGLSTTVTPVADRFSCCSSSSSSDCSSSSSDCLPREANLICQDSIPATLSTSGTYIVTENLTYSGSGSAISITADNVKLLLGNNSITLTNSNATGIHVNNVSEFVIASDAITNSSGTQNGYGIHIQASEKGIIDNVFTVNHFYGLFIENSSDIRVLDSQFSQATDAAAYVTSSRNVTFDGSVFLTSKYGLYIDAAAVNQDIQVLNSQFPSATLQNLVALRVNGMIVENSAFNNAGGDTSLKTSLVQFGGSSANQVANDVVFSNSTIRNRPVGVGGNTLPEGLAIVQGSGFVVDSVMINIDNTGQSDEQSGIHIGDGSGAPGAASNVVIRNSVIQGPAIHGIYPDVNSTGVVIENNLVTGAQENGIFLAGTFDSSVQNNTVVNNGSNGIFVGETSIGNSVSYNVVNDNGFALGVVAPNGAGVGIEAGSTSNTVQYNQLFNNALAGVNDQGPNNASANQVWNNTAFANGTPTATAANYIALAHVIITNTPGAATTAGANVSA